MKEMIARVGDSINKNGIASVCLTGEELVRCKDCQKRNQHHECAYGYHSDDWFCADGERQTD